MKHRPSAAILALAFLSACALTAPLTRQEFIGAVKAGKGPTKAESYTVGRGFGEVYETLARNVPRCLDRTVKRSGGAAGPAHASSSRYNPKLKKESGGKALFSLQVLHRPRGVGVKQPDDGIFVMASDISSIQGGRTRIDVWHATWGYAQIAESFEHWARGSGDRCPELK